MAKDNKKLWGIDLGGTKIEGVVINSPNISEVLCRTRISTEADKGYKHILNRIKELIGLMSEEVKSTPEILGIGTPGNLDPQTYLLKNSNSTSLNGQPFKQDLEDLLGIEVKMANDANCFALAETRLGIVQDINSDAEVVFGVIMGTGVGGGLVVNGKVINGHQGIGGEWGHNFLDASGGKCYCGKSGCVETIIAGPALERYYQGLSGEHKKLKDIVIQQEGDKYAAATLERLAHFFGLGISNIINILDPDVIVLGGGVGNIDILYNRGVKEAEKYTFNTSLKTPIVRPKLGDSAGVFGAALLVS
ncbi:ROK family protein [Fulvivirga sp. 29W222]|uniref:ROK family protein n=1 Tax=Fulvivirga marina TaxID=2494733 RepID=A0A937G225_9BACT|nr:ROK family protein [Fulvivirga marina]MBL6449068.1 ROK family protein [Fulvivirga marina]